jgi:hypothetical protein
MKQLSAHYLEDFAVGQTFGSGPSSIRSPSILMRRRLAARFLVD